ncbi:MAG: hypothetical protein ACYDBQ_09240 [Thermoplasmatota archaeon]
MSRDWAGDESNRRDRDAGRLERAVMEERQFREGVAYWFERTGRATSSTLLALSGAILAGIGQLAGNRSLRGPHIPTVSGLVLVLGFMSLLAGGAYLWAAFNLALRAHGSAQEGGRYTDLEPIHGYALRRLPQILLVQGISWLAAAVTYGLVLYLVATSS